MKWMLFLDLSLVVLNLARSLIVLRSK